MAYQYIRHGRAAKRGVRKRQRRHQTAAFLAAKRIGSGVGVSNDMKRKRSYRRAMLTP